MAVRSKPLESGAPASNSAVFDRAALEQSRGKVERLSAWVVLFASALGAVVTFHGGSWAQFLNHPSLGRAAAGIGLQLVLTYMQWAYYRVRAVAWPARAIDAVTTAIGYGSLIHGAVVDSLVANGASAAPVLPGIDPAYVLGTVSPWSLAAASAWVVLWLAALLPAWYPESRLVD